MTTPHANTVLNQVKAYKNEAISLLRDLTEQESPSTQPEVQIDVSKKISLALQDIDFISTHIKGKNSGGMLYAKPENRVSGKQLQLLLGHFDTVWPTGTLNTMPFEIDGSIIRGPGTYDMKAGIIQAIFALKTIKTLRLNTEVTPILFFNSDEEIGSHESTRYIRRLAQRMNRVFVLEPSMGLAGKLKTARKAVGRYQIAVVGKAAHAGLDPETGASAILELSHVIQKLFALNDPKKGISVNVGTIDGGLRPNVIAPQSQAVVDVRTRTQSDAEELEKIILSLEPEIPGTALKISGRIGRPAMERTPGNQALWKLSQQLASEIGLELEQGQAGGGSDGNTTSQYTATLDGLGAVGDGAHADHEQIDIDKTLERTALLTLLLLAPPLNTT